MDVLGAFLQRHSTDSEEEVVAVLSELRKSRIYEMRMVTNNKGSTKLSCQNPDKLGRVASVVITSLRPTS